MQPWLVAAWVLAIAGSADSTLLNVTVRPQALLGSGDAHERNDTGLLWSRRVRIRDLEEKVLRSPHDAALLNQLGAAYLDSGFRRLAQRCFRRALVERAGDADAHFGLALLGIEEWIDSPTMKAFRVVEQQLEAATDSRPDYVEAWTMLAALHFERRDPWSAVEAADRSLASGPQRAEAHLASAYLAYRTGQLRDAIRLFDLAIPRLPPLIRRRFMDIELLLDESAAGLYRVLAPKARADFERRFWQVNDPDPTTPENEGQIEYWSRLAHALLLLRNPWSPLWEGRTNLYARYGRNVQVAVAPDEERTEMAHLAWGEVAVDPTPEQLAPLRQNALSGGQAILAPLVPGDHERAVASAILRFETDRTTRLLARVVTPGLPGEHVSADAVAVDADGRIVARSSGALTTSACDPAGERAGDFVLQLPEGRYYVVTSIRDSLRGRGVARTEAVIVDPGNTLSLSDLVVECGSPAAALQDGGVRLSPSVSGSVGASDQLVVYFEIYHLRTDANGGSRFAYEYVVEPVEPRNPSGPLEFHASQAGVGALRRQFLQIPILSLRPGRYQLTVRVEDELARTTTWATREFTRE